MRIEIHIRRPLLTIALIALACFVGISIAKANMRAIGGAIGGESIGATLVSTTQTIENERMRQYVLSHRREIIEHQLKALERQVNDLKTPEALEQWRDAKLVLQEILEKEHLSKELLLQSLNALWESEGHNVAVDSGETANDCRFNTWPVKRTNGISAYANDDEYFKKFGINHNAIDIPVEQGTTIVAPANGTVIDVNDQNGIGYNSLTILHDNGYKTIYGHIIKALVQKGERVAEGDEIALSGGMPGTNGAGLFTTGSHLHFAVKKDRKDEKSGAMQSVFIDPLRCLVRADGA